MQEIWKPVVGWEGLYEVSNLGNIRTLDKYVNSAIKNNNKVKRKGKLLKQYIKNQYLQVTLTYNNKRKYINVHRLVAEAFLSNPNKFPQVNHKDENKLNNCVDNLEWCSAKYNCNYGNRNKKIYENNPFKSIKVNQYDLNNNLINSFDSIAEASRYFGCSSLTISRYCRNITKCKNYIWRYADK